ncbi:T9SS type A sorting domain-containing protein [Chryseobacterium sp. Tr-659]|uniref:GEVED domain-containing protein n=1 Tax=Chryseobacterium sp. Tr-659 TaxID=2608340 RepID=UPI001421CB0E|nr:GEVED domain-containing protein [Chryseobacterium sp. Tr-659]NIF04021.1 T9SS type A sorting domain-containing protein [Chryseobacterium sp. Tr-659]
MKNKLLLALMLGTAFSAKAQYCTVNINCSDSDVITNVTFAGINNNSGCSPNGYGSYIAAAPAQVIAGQASPISVTVGNGWYERVSVWIDYNNNQTFEASEFLGEIGNGGEGVTVSGSITVPVTVPTGSYRMRVLCFAAGQDEAASEDPCINDADQYGEYEDYMVSVTNNNLAVNESSKTKNVLSVYPNPATNTFEIKTSNKLKKIVLFESGGKLVKTFNTPQEKYDISDLAPGVYILKIEGDDSQTVKIVKK